MKILKLKTLKEIQKEMKNKSNYTKKKIEKTLFELEKQKVSKYLYYGQYNWYGEIHKLWTRAKTPTIANKQILTKLAKLLNISNYKLRCYFNGNKDNFKITKHEI